MQIRFRTGPCFGGKQLIILMFGYRGPDYILELALGIRS